MCPALANRRAQTLTIREEDGLCQDKTGALASAAVVFAVLLGVAATGPMLLWRTRLLPAPIASADSIGLRYWGSSAAFVVGAVGRVGAGELVGGYAPDPHVRLVGACVVWCDPVIVVGSSRSFFDPCK